MRKSILFTIIIYFLFQFNTLVFADDFMELLSKATNAYKLGNYQSAIYYYDKMIEIDPQNAGAYSLKGIIYLEEYGNYELAISNFSNAIKYNPKEASNYTSRGIARMKLGDTDGAATDLTKAISINNQNRTPEALPYCTRALVYSIMGKYQETILDATNAIKIQPKYPEAFHYRGLAKLNVAASQKSTTGVNDAIKDLNFAKEQCLQLGNMEEYQNVMKSYKMATSVLELLNKGAIK